MKGCRPEHFPPKIILNKNVGLLKHDDQLAGQLLLSIICFLQVCYVLSGHKNKEADNFIELFSFYILRIQARFC